MGKINTRAIGKWFKKHAPEITLGAGVVGLLTSNVLTALATVRAVRNNDKIEAELGRKTTKKEKIKNSWKYYAAPTAVAATSAGAVLYADKMNLKKNAVAMSGWVAEKAAFNDYREIVREKLTDKKSKEIEDEYREKRSNNVQLMPYNPEALKDDQFPCFDEYYNIWFAASKNEIDQAVNRVNRRTSLLETAIGDNFYDELEKIQDSNGTNGYRNGQPIVRSILSGRLGWPVGTELSVDTEDTGIRPTDGKPAIFITYSPAPVYDYRGYKGLEI